MRSALNIAALSAALGVMGSPVKTPPPPGLDQAGLAAMLASQGIVLPHESRGVGLSPIVAAATSLVDDILTAATHIPVHIPHHFDKGDEALNESVENEADASTAKRSAAESTEKLDKDEINDYKILNYALTLEQLEEAFYRKGLSMFSYQDFRKDTRAPLDRGAFYKNLRRIYYDEYVHVGVLEGILGKYAVKPCTYDFPFKTPSEFIALASVLEGVGVSAYLGAAKYIKDKELLTGAASILAVEAQHNAYLRASEQELPFASPFATPLDFDEVYSLATAFIVKCPKQNKWKPQLNLKKFPELVLSKLFAKKRIEPGQWIVLNTPDYKLVPHSKREKPHKLHAAWITFSGPIFSEVRPVHGDYFGGGYWVKVPYGVEGQSYVILTQCDEVPITDASIAAGPAIVEVTVFDTYGKFGPNPVDINAPSAHPHPFAGDDDISQNGPRPSSDVDIPSDDPHTLPAIPLVPAIHIPGDNPQGGSSLEEELEGALSEISILSNFPKTRPQGFAQEGPPDSLVAVADPFGIGGDDIPTQTGPLQPSFTDDFDDDSINETGSPLDVLLQPPTATAELNPITDNIPGRPDDNDPEEEFDNILQPLATSLPGLDSLNDLIDDDDDIGTINIPGLPIPILGGDDDSVVNTGVDLTTVIEDQPPRTDDETQIGADEDVNSEEDNPEDERHQRKRRASRF